MTLFLAPERCIVGPGRRVRICVDGLPPTDVLVISNLQWAEILNLPEMQNSIVQQPMIFQRTSISLNPYMPVVDGSADADNRTFRAKLRRLKKPVRMPLDAKMSEQTHENRVLHEFSGACQRAMIAIAIDLKLLIAG